LPAKRKEYGLQRDRIRCLQGSLHGIAADETGFVFPAFFFPAAVFPFPAYFRRKKQALFFLPSPYNRPLDAISVKKTKKLLKIWEENPKLFRYIDVSGKLGAP